MDQGNQRRGRFAPFRSVVMRDDVDKPATQIPLPGQGRASIFVSKAHGLALGFIEGDSALVRQLHSLGKFFGKGQPDAAIVPQSCA